MTSDELLEVLGKLLKAMESANTFPYKEKK